MLTLFVSPVMHAENEEHNGRTTSGCNTRRKHLFLRNLRTACLYNELAFKVKYCLLQLSFSSPYVFKLENHNKQSPGACQQQTEWMWKTARESIWWTKTEQRVFVFAQRVKVSSCIATLLITTSILTTNPFSTRHSSQRAKGPLEALMIALRSSSIVSRKCSDTLEQRHHIFVLDSPMKETKTRRVRLMRRWQAAMLLSGLFL